MGVIHAVRLLMEKNEHLEKLVPVILDTGIMQHRRAVLALRRTKAQQPDFQACYNAHRAEFEKLAGMLADDFSRQTLQAVIDYRLEPAAGLRGGGNR